MIKEELGGGRESDNGREATRERERHATRVTKEELGGGRETDNGGEATREGGTCKTSNQEQ